MVRGRQARKRVQQRLQVVFDTGIAEIDLEVAQLEVIYNLKTVLPIMCVAALCLGFTK